MESLQVKNVMFSFLILMCSFIIVLISISRIIELAKSSSLPVQIAENVYEANYSTATQAYYPYEASYPESTILEESNLSYQRHINELSSKFPASYGIAAKLDIDVNMARLIINEQANALRLNLLESRIGSMQRELDEMIAASSEPLIFKLAFYFWGFLVWMGSVVIGRILKHLTDRFNNKYLGSGEVNL